MSRFRSQLSRLNAALAKRVLSELPHRPCSDATLLRAVRNCAETGQGRLTVALYEGYRDTQTLPLKPELAAQLIRSLGTERLPHAPAAAGMAPLEHVRHPHRMRHPFASMRLPMRMLLHPSPCAWCSADALDGRGAGGDAAPRLQGDVRYAECGCYPALGR